MRGVIAVVLATSLAGCQKADNDSKPAPVTTDPGLSGPGSNKVPAPIKPRSEQVQPPVDLKNPPGDAVKTASGLIYKKLVTNDAGAAPKRNDTVLINYTGWRQSTGETFFTNRSRSQPMPLNLSTTAPGFTEAMQLLKKGEKAVLWVPPSIGYKGPPQGTPETLVYEVEIVDIQPAPVIPPDVAKAPDNAETLKSGIKFTEVHAGTGKDKARAWDTVTFNYTAWDSDGRMFDTTETRHRPGTVQPFRPSAAMEDMLTSLVVGERRRYWVAADKMAQAGKPLPGSPQGQLCYEVELVQLTKAPADPPPVPPDVAKPPADAKKTPRGVFYKVLKQGKGGPKPTTHDTVKVNYTGWTTDGKMFDSSVIRNEPAEFSLQGGMLGWTEGITQMSVGDKFRLWIPEELAYKGAPGRPQGMLVFDFELLEIKPTVSNDRPPKKP